MRIISGSARGRKLETPKGDDIRPTSDMVKESIFNIIQFDVQSARVLDLFAGTGQLGIEALSRGAKSCVFVDASQDSLLLAKKNIAISGFSDVSEVFRSDAASYLSRAGKFDIIFVDPPYETDLINVALEKITAFDILNERGIIVCESRVERSLPELDAPYRKTREYRYGKIKITTYIKETD
ncbi:MAG: 16S rRNA (guanine(966)-N(2))-methyltransferase RsmD [Oscillospiraceae bacterium]|jgi:16S rRNA (guanine(966)-N(2))-methyltransferase RsmD|nr:16S rRNA (guanine(966)-N(2))-methyltransferase RsmD [Oscillospiraceae bacterium]